MRVQELHPPNSINPVGQERTPYHSLGTSRWPLNPKRPYPPNQLNDYELKLDELKTLLYRNFPPYVAAQLFEQNSNLDNTPENNNYLDIIMNGLRKRSGSA